jgi:hypothetical protein
MARQLIDIGLEGNDGTGDSIRESFRKTNENFRELYAIFTKEGELSFLDLGDTPSTFDGAANQIVMVNQLENSLNFRNLVAGEGIVINVSNDTVELISNPLSRLVDDPRPRLATHLNAQAKAIGNIVVPTTNTDVILSEFQVAHPDVSIDINSFAINKGYADNRYVDVAGDLMTGALRTTVVERSLPEYRIISSFTQEGFLVIPNHGLTANDIDGDPWVYNSTDTPASGVENNATYYARVVDDNTISLHTDAAGAFTGTGARVLSGGTGVQSIKGFYYNPLLDGNWNPDEIVPRDFVVRRQGDRMTGGLYLNDHPFPLSGSGTPQGLEDLRAATKFYVDNSSFASQINLYVSTSGADEQPFTPPGREGRSLAYAFGSIAKACAVAEEIINESDWEPGPYRQLIAFNGGTGFSKLQAVHNSSSAASLQPDTGAAVRLFFGNNAGNRVDQGDPANLDIVPGKLIRGVLSNARGFITEYYGFSSSAQIADDPDTADSDYVDLRDVKGAFAEAKRIVGITDWSFEGTTITVNATAHGLYAGQTITVSGAVTAGNAPNGTFIVDTIVNANRFTYKTQIAPSGTLVSGSLTIDVQGEELEFAEAVKIQQVTVIIESGIYYEHFPIRIPANTSILGDEYRRCIVRPKNSISQSRWVNIWFYRDKMFDGMTITNDGFPYTNPRTDEVDGYFGYHYLTDPTDINSTPKNNQEIDCFLCGDATIVRQITVQGHGGFMMVLDPETQILSKSPYCQQGSSFSGSINKQRFAGGQFVDGFCGNLPASVISIPDPESIVISGIPRAPQIPTSYFIQGQRFKINTYTHHTNGDFNAGEILRANRQFIAEEVTGYMSAPVDAGGLNYSDYNEEKCLRDIGLIVDALVFDLTYGGNTQTCFAARRYYYGTASILPSNEKEKTADAYEYLATIAKNIIVNSPVSNSYQSSIAQNTSLPSGLIATAPRIDDLIQIINDGITLGAQTIPQYAGIGYEYPLFKLIIDPGTPVKGNPISVTLLTAGNTSMLSNDYTQVNDLGYGLAGANNALIETVSVFTYYCQASFYVNSGAQVRSLNGSSCQGEFGLVAEGADPLEYPDLVNLNDNMVQWARVYKRNSYANNTGEAGKYELMIEGFQYAPYDGGFIEIDHGGDDGIVTYPVSGYSDATGGAGDPSNPPAGTILRTTLTISSIAGIAGNGLATDITDGQLVLVRNGAQLKFRNVLEIRPTRPSTALTYIEHPNNLIEPATGESNAQFNRVIAYNPNDPLGNPLNRSLSISSITRSSPAVLQTAANHGFSDGDYVRIRGLKPSWNSLEWDSILDNRYYVKTRPSPDEIELYTDANLTVPVNTSAVSENFAPTLGTETVTKNYDIAILETDDTFRYLELTIHPTATTTTEAAAGISGGSGSKRLGSLSQDRYIALAQGIASLDVLRINSGDMIFGWGGKIHRATGITQGTPGTYDILAITDTDKSGAPLQNINSSPVAGLQIPVVGNGVIRLGLIEGEPAEITVNISTCRATGHDFLDIGTGGYNNTNYPEKIFGPPVNKVNPDDRIVKEKTQGRVFHASTDQNGFFRIGRFFSVDQGTGEVTIDAGRISLSGVTGLKFRSGVLVTEFSADSTFATARNDNVATMIATEEYISARLGKTRAGTAFAGTIIGGSGFLDRDGVLGYRGGTDLQNLVPLNLGGARISDLANPDGDQDAVTKAYVRSQELSDDRVDTGSRAANDLLIYNGTNWVNGQTSTVGDITATIDVNNLSLTIKDQVIFDDNVNPNAAITQTKLNLSNAPVTAIAGVNITSSTSNGTSATITFSATSVAPFTVGSKIVVAGAQQSALNGTHQVTACTTTQVSFDISITGTGGAGGTVQAQRGVAAFNSGEFNTTVGYIGLKDSGIALGKIAQIANNTVVANNSGSVASPTAVTFSDIISGGGALFSSAFPDVGAMVVTSLTPTKSFSTLSISTTATNDTLVKRTSTGKISGVSLQLNDKDALIANTTNVTMLSPSGTDLISGSGTTKTNVQVRLFGSTTVLGNITTGLPEGAPSNTTFNITCNGEVSGSSGNFKDSVKTYSLVARNKDTGATNSDTAGQIQGYWSLGSGSRLEATYSADLAEFYEADRTYDLGTVLVFGGEKEVTVTTTFSDRRVAGVVSENPAFIMNGQCPGIKTCIALQGRVPVKVIGKVKKGDMLVTSARPGYAMVNHDPKMGTVIGKALENKDTLDDGFIEVAVGRT